MLFIPLFLLIKARVECSFTFGLYMYCCFKAIVSIITRLLSTIFYINSSRTNNYLHAWFCRTRYNSSFHNFFKYYFTIKFACNGFKLGHIWLYGTLNFVLIFLCKNLPSLTFHLLTRSLSFPKHFFHK
jgi:hypothetical protein